MTVQEAIKHCEEKAKEKYAEGMLCHANPNDDLLDGCIQCAKEHEQLAEWLKELEQYRALGTVEELKEAREKQPKSDWIPCEVEMPKTLITDNQISEEDYMKSRYLISNGEVTHVAIWTQKGFRPIEDFSTVIEDVVAWKPLPQPYKKEGAENE